MNLFFDTSALVKFFHEEIGSQKVTDLILDKDNDIYISDIAIIEFISSLHKKFRNKELSENNLKKAITGFKQSIVNYNVQPFSQTVGEEAEKLILLYGKSYSLRTLDAMQLATYNLIFDKNSRFVCADNNLCFVAKLAGHKFINPNDER